MPCCSLPATRRSSADRPLADDALQAARAAIETILTAQEPFPALAIDRRWNLVAAN